MTLEWGDDGAAVSGVTLAARWLDRVFPGALDAAGVNRALLHDTAVADTTRTPPDTTMALRDIVSPAALAPMLQADDAAYAALARDGAVIRQQQLARVTAILDATGAVWGDVAGIGRVLTIDNAEPLLVNGVLGVALQRAQFADCTYLLSIAGRDSLGACEDAAKPVYVSARIMHGGTSCVEALGAVRAWMARELGAALGDVSFGGHSAAAGGTFPAGKLAAAHTVAAAACATSH
jgi:hypothetical protein